MSDSHKNRFGYLAGVVGTLSGKLTRRKRHASKDINHAMLLHANENGEDVIKDEFEMFTPGVRELSSVELVLDRQSLLLLVVNHKHDTVDQYDLLKLHEVRTGPKIIAPTDASVPLPDRRKTLWLFFGDSILLDNVWFTTNQSAIMAKWHPLLVEIVDEVQSAELDVKNVLSWRCMAMLGPTAYDAEDAYALLTPELVARIASLHQVTLELKDQQALVGLALSHLHDQPKPHDKSKEERQDDSDVLSPFQVLEAIVDQLHLIGADHWYGRGSEPLTAYLVSDRSSEATAGVHHNSALNSHSLPGEKVREFLTEVQLASSGLTDRIHRRFCQRYGPRNKGRQAEPSADYKLYAAAIMDWFHSSLNSALHPMAQKSSGDLDKPLHHYFISSSHNTYLSGKQVMDLSSTEMYAQVLLAGCRCVELDCWDGTDGEPIITHGGAYCTNISFLEVCRVIRQHAFTASHLPLILSLEVHCSVPQQDRMATILHAEMGSLLLTSPLSGSLDDHDRLPSPQELQQRILVKWKPLPDKDNRDDIDDDDDTSRLGVTVFRGYVALAPETDTGLFTELQSEHGADVTAAEAASHSAELITAASPSLEGALSALDSTVGAADWVVCYGLLTEQVFVYGTAMKDSNEMQEEASMREEVEDMMLNDSVSGSAAANIETLPLTALRKAYTLPPATAKAMAIKAGCGLVLVANDSYATRGVVLVAPSPHFAGQWVRHLNTAIYNRHQYHAELKVTRSIALCESVVYTQAVKFKSFDQVYRYYQMSSFGEKKLLKLAKHSSPALVKFTRRNLSRVYPRGSRINSTNYDPCVSWNAGVQMVALNWQTADEPMWLLRGWFDRHNSTGYVLKPAYLRKKNSNFDPLSQNTLDDREPVSLKLRLLEARHLPGIDSKAQVTASVSLHGSLFDENKPERQVNLNSQAGMSAYFDLEINSDIFFPELASLLITFSVSKRVIAQVAVPVACLRPGYRSLRLYSPHNRVLVTSSALLYLELTQNEAVWGYSLDEIKAEMAKPAPSTPVKGHVPLSRQLRAGLHQSPEAAAARKKERQATIRKKQAEAKSRVSEYVAAKMSAKATREEGVSSRPAHSKFVGLHGEKSVDVSKVQSKIAQYISKDPSNAERNPNKTTFSKPKHEKFVGLSKKPTRPKTADGDSKAKTPSPTSTSAAGSTSPTRVKLHPSVPPAKPKRSKSSKSGNPTARSTVSAAATATKAASESGSSSQSEGKAANGPSSPKAAKGKLGTSKSSTVQTEVSKTASKAPKSGSGASKPSSSKPTSSTAKRVTKPVSTSASRSNPSASASKTKPSASRAASATNSRTGTATSTSRSTSRPATARSTTKTGSSSSKATTSASKTATKTTSKTGAARATVRRPPSATSTTKSGSKPASKLTSGTPTKSLKRDKTRKDSSEA
eukprot:m.263823 g.263823  ORF g.263823 m.263823 type:complete len:1409 (-) comp17614_c0_seq1:1909-6135(-)